MQLRGRGSDGSKRVSALQSAASAFLLATVALFLSTALAPAARVQQPGIGDADLSPGLSKQALLGRLLFFDDTLSTPVGQACSSCHAPQAGFRFPDSRVNEVFGVATGAIAKRVTNRSVPTISYAAYIPKGPPQAHFQNHANPSSRSQMHPLLELLYIGGMFWDGRAIDLADQARFPFQNPNEMNDLVHNLGSPGLVVRKVANGEYAALVRTVYGEDIFDRQTDVIFTKLCEAIAAFEQSREVSPFTSKYDAFRLGRIRLTPEEMDGLRLMTGTWNGLTAGDPFPKNAQCITCHGIEDNLADGHSLWTFSCYANIGAPRNRKNPFYAQIDASSNPAGFNPLGEHFTDFGLGDFLYPQLGLPPGNTGPGSDGFGDYLAANGAVKVPTLRNVDMRPSSEFVKPYMHNGVFKSLKEVVHWYNTRNLTSVRGEVIDFTLADPYANLVGTPIWPRPEISSPDSLANPDGVPGEDGGQLGNLGLTDEEEDHIVAFMKTLTDGYFQYQH